MCEEEEEEEEGEEGGTEVWLLEKHRERRLRDVRGRASEKERVQVIDMTVGFSARHVEGA